MNTAIQAKEPTWKVLGYVSEEAMLKARQAILNPPKRIPTTKELRLASYISKNKEAAREIGWS